MARPMREYHLAGLALDEANEKRDSARAKLREAALRVCPDEVKALDAASDAVKAAESKLAHVMVSITRGEMTASMNAHAEEHAASCDDPNCEVKKALRRQTPQGAGGGAAN